MVVGDWNNPPHVIRDAIWLQAVEGVIMVAKNNVVSCTSGKGAMLDYAVASVSMAPGLFDLALEVMPWKPHLAFVFRVDAPREQMVARTLACPRTPDFGAVQRDQTRLHNAQSEEQAQLWAWAASRVRCFPTHCSLPQLKCGVAYDLNPNAALELGERYRVFITASELYHAKSNEVLKTNLIAAVGRGAGPPSTMWTKQRVTPIERWSMKMLRHLS